MTARTTLLMIAIAIAIGCTDNNHDDDEGTVRDASQVDLLEHDYFTTNEVSLIGLDAENYASAQFDQEAALGRLLFYDKILSLNNTISCASCHEQQLAFADGKRFSQGIFGEETSRNSMSLLNCGNDQAFFWDGASKDISTAVGLPIVNHVEMGMEKLEDLVEKISRSDYYPTLFDQVYATSTTDGTPTLSAYYISNSLGRFVESIISVGSPFQANGTDQLSVAEQRGWTIFNTKGTCNRCHRAIDNRSGWVTEEASIGLDEVYDDPGMGDGIFKVPTLSNIAMTGPYMHDGRFETLDEVIEHYNSGIKASNRLSWWLRDNDGNPVRLGLTTDEKSDLKAFLETLTDEEVLSDARFSDPF